jgi:hypothetical protein
MPDPVVVTAEHQRYAHEAIDRFWPHNGEQAPALLMYAVAAAIAEAEARGEARARVADSNGANGDNGSNGAVDSA